MLLLVLLDDNDTANRGVDGVFFLVQQRVRSLLLTLVVNPSWKPLVVVVAVVEMRTSVKILMLFMFVFRFCCCYRNNVAVCCRCSRDTIVLLPIIINFVPLSKYSSTAIALRFHSGSLIALNRFDVDVWNVDTCRHPDPSSKTLRQMAGIFRTSAHINTLTLRTRKWWHDLILFFCTK